MAITPIDWDAWHKHINQKIHDEGQWIGLADENWQPICDMPKALELTASNTRLSAADLTIKLPATPNGTPHKVVDELIAEDLGVFSADGRLTPSMHAARNIIIQRRGTRARQAYFITHTLAEGNGQAPTTITPSGQDLLGLLAATPCPSVPRKWGTEPIQQWDQDAGGKYKTKRTYGAVQMADELDGYTMHGPAVPTIRTLIQDSIDAVCHQMQWHQPHLTVDMSTDDTSPEILIQLTDQTIWEAIAEPARLSGITISAHLWWPGDDPILTRPQRNAQPSPTTWRHPICVIRVETSKEAP